MHWMRGWNGAFVFPESKQPDPLRDCDRVLKRRIASLAVFFGLALLMPTRAATDLYWDADGGASPATGGTGNWLAANSWRSGSPTGALQNWADNNNAILTGSAGVVSLGTNGNTSVIAGTITVNADGYSIVSTNAGRTLTATSLVIGNNAGLTLNLNNVGSTWALGGIAFGAGSLLTVTGIGVTANRINLYVPGASISGGSITLSGSGGGVTGFVSTAAGVSLGANITNNSSTSNTMLGATSGNDLTVSGTVAGSAGLQFSVGASGGAGTITINAANTYTGPTTFNANSSCVIKLGVQNALPVTTNVRMAATGGNGGILDLNGHDQTVSSLASVDPGGGGSITNNCLGTATLTVSGTGTASDFFLPITDGINGGKIALVKGGCCALNISGSCNYSGSTTVNGGVLVISGSLTATSSVTVSSGTLQLGADNAIATTAHVTLGNGVITAANHKAAFANLTNAGDSVLDLGIGSNAAVLRFGDSHVCSWSGTLTILNWNGKSAGAGDDQIFFGNTLTGLTDGQLADMTFLNPTIDGTAVTGTYDAQILSTGEIVPVPEPGTEGIMFLNVGLMASFQRMRRRIS